MDCPICNNVEYQPSADGHTINCDVCSEYHITDSATFTINSVLRERKYLLSGVIREKKLLNPKSLMTITPENMEQLTNSLPTSLVTEKIDRLLLNFEKMCLHVGDNLVLKIETDYPLAYAKNSIEFDFYIDYLLDTGLLKNMNIPGTERRITIDGWKRIQDIKKPSRSSPKSSVISS